MTIFERVKSIADKKGLSLQTVAQRAGFGINSIYGWKKKDPSVSRVEKVAKVLGVTTDYLLGNDSDRKKDGLSVDEAVDNLRSYQGKLVSDDQKDVLKDLIKGYLDRNSK